MGNDNVQAQPEEEPCGNMITEMLPRSDHAYMTQMDADKFYFQKC